MIWYEPATCKSNAKGKEEKSQWKNRATWKPIMMIVLFMGPSCVDKADRDKTNRFAYQTNCFMQLNDKKYGRYLLRKYILCSNWISNLFPIVSDEHKSGTHMGQTGQLLIYHITKWPSMQLPTHFLIDKNLLRKVLIFYCLFWKFNNDFIPFLFINKWEGKNNQFPFYIRRALILFKSTPKAWDQRDWDWLFSTYIHQH